MLSPRLSFLLAPALSVPAAAQGGVPPVILLINEIRIDQPSADTDEFFELFSVPANSSLDGLTYLVLGDNTAGGSGVIEFALDLTGSATNAQGLFLAGEATLTLGLADLTASLNFENGDNVTHLVVEGFTGAVNDDLDVDDDGTLDSTPWTAIFDAVSLVETTTPSIGSGDEWFYASSLGFTDVGPDGPFVPGHAFRCLTSLTDWRIGPFVVSGFDTPATFNLTCSAPTTSFCDPPAANSVSALGSTIGFTGSGSVQINDNALVASPLPDNFGVFVQADDMGSPIASPIGGNICLRGTFQRMNVVVLATGGQATLPLDFSDPSLVEGSTEAGVTLYYQLFHRDTFFPGGGNWTNALGVTWAP
ncbi:MAG: hypothetical protein AAF726_22410 [Planctomycetota bacterium]